MANVVEGDFLNEGWNVLEASDDERTPSVDGVRGRICRQLERLQLHRQGWQSQEQKNYQDKGSRNQNGGLPRTHLTHHRGVRLGQPRSNGTGLLLSHMKGCLEDPETNLKLAVFRVTS